MLQADGGTLLDAWEKDQGLSGLRARKGEGGDLRRELEKAVGDALKKGFTNRPPSWSTWERAAAIFRPDESLRRGRQVLAGSLEGMEGRGNPSDPEALAMRRELINALVEGGQAVDRGGEFALFRRLMKKASGALRMRLAAIDAYEGFRALVTDGFGLIRRLSTELADRPVDEERFARESLARDLARDLPGSLEKVERAFGDPRAPEAVEGLLARYSRVSGPAELFRTILEHHHAAQEAKPPDGKRPWVETVTDGVAGGIPGRAREGAQHGVRA